MIKGDSREISGNMILDNDNIISKECLDIPITFELLCKLGFTVYGVSIETDEIYLNYKETHLDFSVHNLDATYDNLTITTLHTSKRLSLTNVDQLMTYINDTGYRQ